MAQRTRIGLIVPSSDVTCEPDFVMATPANVTVHSQRLWFQEGGGRENHDLMTAGLPEAARYLATAEVEAIALGCTTASFYKGPGWDTQLVGMMEEAVGVPALVTSLSVVQALRFIGATKLSVATPYGEWNNQKLTEYLEATGFQVLNLEADPWVSQASDRRIGDREPEAILGFAEAACRSEADALFLSCTAWRSMEIADELERRLGKPVITSNQAMIWRMLRILGITDPVLGFGNLLESLSASALATAP